MSEQLRLMAWIKENRPNFPKPTETWQGIVSLAGGIRVHLYVWGDTAADLTVYKATTNRLLQLGATTILTVEELQHWLGLSTIPHAPVAGGGAPARATARR